MAKIYVLINYMFYITIYSVYTVITFFYLTKFLHCKTNKGILILIS